MNNAIAAGSVARGGMNSAFTVLLMLLTPSLKVLVIGLVGEILEDWTFRRTRSALAGLARLTPRRCWRTPFPSAPASSSITGCPGWTAWR